MSVHNQFADFTLTISLRCLSFLTRFPLQTLSHMYEMCFSFLNVHLWSVIVRLETLFYQVG